jgi:hypothetical protein
MGIKNKNGQRLEETGVMLLHYIFTYRYAFYFLIRFSLIITYNICDTALHITKRANKYCAFMYVNCFAYNLRQCMAYTSLCTYN